MNRRFWQQSAALTIASALAQGVAAGNFLLIGSIYPQADLGVFGVYLAYSALIATVASFGYELAIPNVKDGEVGELLIGVLFLIALVAATAYMVAMSFGYGMALQLATMASAMSMLRCLEMVNVRYGQFSILAGAKVIPHLLVTASVVVMWIHGRVDIRWLIDFVALGYLSTSVLQAVISAKGRMRWDSRIPGFRLLVSNLSYAYRVMPSQLLNQGAYQIPVIAIERFFGASLAGQYFILLRVCFTPINLATSAVGRVVHNRIAESRRENARVDGASLRAIMRTLWIVGGVTALLIFVFYGPVLVRLLGEQWNMSGQLARWMSPLFAIMIATAPLTPVLLVTDSHRALFGSQLQYAIGALAAVGAGVMFHSLTVLIATFSFLGVLRYMVLYNIVANKLAKLTS